MMGTGMSKSNDNSSNNNSDARKSMSVKKSNGSNSNHLSDTNKFMTAKPSANQSSSNSDQQLDEESRRKGLRARMKANQSSKQEADEDLLGNEPPKRVLTHTPDQADQPSRDDEENVVGHPLSKMTLPKGPRQSHQQDDLDVGDDDAELKGQTHVEPLSPGLKHEDALQNTPSAAYTATQAADEEAPLPPDASEGKNAKPDTTPATPSLPQTEQKMEKEADAILKIHLKLYERTKFLRSKPKHLTTAVLKKHVKMVYYSYHIFNLFPHSVMTVYRAKLFYRFIDSGTLAFVCDTLKDGLEKNSYLATTTAITTTTTTATTITAQGSDNDKDLKDRKDGQKVDTDQADILEDCLAVLSNFMNQSNDVKRNVVRRKGLVPCLLDKLDRWYQPHMHGTTMDIEEKYIHTCLTLMFKIQTNDESLMENLRGMNGLFKVLKNYLSSKNDYLRLVCIGTLATLATEKEAKTIAAESDIVRFLIKQLQEAITSEERISSTGWKITGLCRVVKNLARNDANKQLLVKEGSVPLLTTGLKPEYQTSEENTERKRCLECLWWLSFDAKNREEMVKNEELMDLVVDIHKRGPKQNKYAHYPRAEGFLFQMRSTLRKIDKYKGIADKLVYERQKPDGPVSVTPGHVMMSYQTKFRPVVKATFEFLKNKGFPMWMDIYDMADGEESTLQTMAEAVEESSVVIVCFSDSYKNSAFCRGEAEYAFTRNKTIIPMKVEKGYSPDGWLGIILGSKFFYDFTLEGKELQDKRQTLLEAVQKAYALEAETSDGKKVPPSVAAATPRSKLTFEDKVKTWTKTEIEAWRNKFNLEGKEVEAMSGEDIIYLFNLKAKAPEAFQSSVRSDLALTSISATASLNRALDHLPDVAADISQ